MLFSTRSYFAATFGAMLLGATSSFAYDHGEAGPLLRDRPTVEVRQCIQAPITSTLLHCQYTPIPEGASANITAAAHVKRGLELFRHRKNEHAVVHFKLATEVDPDSSNAFLMAARFQITVAQMNGSQEYLNMAKLLLTRAEEIAPDNDDIRSTRAYLLWYDTRRHEALEIYDQVLIDNPRHKFARWQRAQMHQYDRNYEKALDDFDVMLALWPETLHVRWSRASLYLNTGRFDEAVADYTSYIELYPYNREVYIYRSLAHSKAGRAEEALSDINVILDGFDDGTKFAVGEDERAEFLMRRAFIYFQLNKNDLAVADALHVSAQGNVPRLLRLQVFLKKRGFSIQVDGKNSIPFRAAIKECFKVKDCVAQLTQKT